MEPQLSIILPVYNVEAYVKECLDSIYCGQHSESAFEVIVVNDGSTDNSMEKVAPFIKSHGNLTVFNQDNHGLSAARMKGLSLAKGNYIWFIDSDDWLYPDALSTVTDIISQTDCEVLATPLLWCYDNHDRDHVDYTITSSITKLAGKKILAEGIIPVWATPRYIIKRSLFADPFLVFPEGLIHEDEYFGRILMTAATDVYIYNKPIYNYRQRNSSITNTVSMRSSYDLLRIYDKLVRFANSLPDPDRMTFIFHSQSLLVKSYMINKNRWGSDEFNTFKSKNKHHILSEYLKLYRKYSFKELIILAMLTLAPKTYTKVFPNK